MGKTNIEWTGTLLPNSTMLPGYTFNISWGCQKVSPGCEHCYAETLATRWGFDVWGPAKTTSRRLFGAKHWTEPLTWQHEAKVRGIRRKVFCASMGDVFEVHPMLDEPRAMLWNMIEATPDLDWLLLTKRPENIEQMIPNQYWPNVWLGTSTENQEYANQRIPILLEHRSKVPVLFLSIEPMLGPVSFRWAPWVPLKQHDATWHLEGLQQIDWLICGGESGSNHRSFDIAWAKTLQDECQTAKVAFFFKQWGGRTHADGGCLIDGIEIKEFPQPRLPIAV